LRHFRQGYNAEVSVVHVLDVFPFSLSPTAADAARIAELRGLGKARVQEFMQAYGLREAEFTPVVLTGEVSLAVEQFARENTIDLIVLGSRGRVGMNRLFQGSMAEEIFRTAQCPVMVVGPESKEPNASFKRLFLPTDLSRISQAALPYIEFMLR